MTTSAPTELAWRRVCLFGDLEPARGIAVLVGGRRLAVFRSLGGRLHCLADRTMPTGTRLSAGRLAEIGGSPTVIFRDSRQRVDARTGICVTDPALTTRAYPARAIGGVVEVAIPPL